MIRPRIALWGVWTLGVVAGAASCQSAPAVSHEALVQAVEELRAEVDFLKRTVERLEQELAAAKAEAHARPIAPSKTAGAQCAGATTAGARCKRSAREGSRFCWQHAGQ